MATIDWKSAVSGDWSNAADWSGGVVPGAGDTAVINVPGTYTITISKAEAVGSLTVDAAGATVLNDSAMTLSGDLDLAGGTFEMAASGASITGGTIIAASGTFNWDATAGGVGTQGGGSLSGLTFEGPLDLTGVQALTLTDVTFTGAGGIGPGVINLSTAQEAKGTYGGALYIPGGQTLDNVTINSAGGNLIFSNPTDATPVLTLGANFHYVASGQAEEGNILFDSFYSVGSDYNNNKLINNGMISTGSTNTYLSIGMQNFVNNGSMTDDYAGSGLDATYLVSFVNSSTGMINVAGAGAGLNASALAWSNAGTINLGAGTSNQIEGDDPNGTFTNTGTITLGAGASLVLGGDLTTAQLNGINNQGGTITFGGVLNNAGSTLSVGPASDQSHFVLGYRGGFDVVGSSEIVGGMIADPTGAMQFDYGVLSGVSYHGVLNLTEASAALILLGGLTVTGAGGSGSGVINLTGAAGSLVAKDTETLDNATLTIGSSTGDTLDELIGGDTLTLGSGLHIVQGGASAEIGQSGDLTQAVINNGQITAGVSGGDFVIGTGVFTNNGSITASNGDTVQIGTITAYSSIRKSIAAYGKFANFVGSTLTGGVYEVDAGSTIDVYDNSRGKQAAITTDDATIILNGAGSVLETATNTTGGVEGLEQSLTKIGASGVLAILGGRGWTSTLGLGNAGSVQLGGGTFASGAVVNSGSFSGFGRVNAAVNNKGSITASGGALEFQQAVSGAGGVTVAQGASATFDQGYSGKGVFSVAAGATVKFVTASSASGAFTLGAGAAADFQQTETGRGAFSLAAGATLEFGAASLAAVTFTDGGAGATLEIGDISGFGGSINGFGAADTLDLVDTVATNVTWKNGKLTIVDGATTVAAIKLSGTYAGDTFSVTSDGHGGSLIQFAQAAASLGATAAAGGSSSPISGQAVSPLAQLAAPLEA